MNLSPLSISENFRAALAKAGLVFDGEITFDGKLHRFKAAGDREKNSWFVLHAGTPAAGAFGCWKRGVKETWCERDGQLSETELKEVRARWQEAEREREQIEAKRQAKAQKIAAWIFERATQVTTHAYLTAKIEPTDAGTENNRKSTVDPVVSEPISAPPEPEIHFPAILTAAIPLTTDATQFPARHKRKRITSENMATIFRHGSRKLNLTTAVAELKGLGFGKTAAYEALSTNGQFSAWLRFTPDGIITWSDR